MKKLKINLFEINTLILSILIFVSNDTILFGTNSNKFFFKIHVVILTILLIFLFYKNNLRIKKSLLKVLVLLIFFSCLTMISNFDTQLIKYIYNIFLMSLCTFVVMKIPVNQFIDKYKNIIYTIALFTIILFIVGFFGKNYINSFPYVLNDVGNKFYFLGIGFIEESKYSKIPRMSSFFREPGVYGCFLILSLIFELFFSIKVNIKHILVISIACLLTFSTAVYIILIICFFIFFIKDMSEKKVKESLFLFFLLMVISLMLIEILGFDYLIKFIFNKFHTSNASKDARYSSVINNIKIFLESPFFGKGWSFLENNFSIIGKNNGYLAGDNTNTYLKYLAIYGFFPFFILVMNILKFFSKILENNRYMGVILTIVWLVTLSNEDMCINFIAYLLPLYGIKNNIKL